MSQKVILWPHKVAEKLGQEATQEIVEMINEAVASVSATKVDKTDYDAHAQLIEARFDKLEANTKAQIRGALLTGLAWVTVLAVSLYGALWNSAKTLLEALVK